MACVYIERWASLCVSVPILHCLFSLTTITPAHEYECVIFQGTQNLWHSNLSFLLTQRQARKALFDNSNSRKVTGVKKIGRMSQEVLKLY